MTDRDRKQVEVDANYQAFHAMLPELIKTNPGKFALMRDKLAVEFFDTARDAYVFGHRLYDDGLFSVQEVTTVPLNLGWVSYYASAHAAI